MKIKTENIIVAGLWLVIFLFPVIIHHVPAEEENNVFRTELLRNSYTLILWFFGMFLVHNYLLMSYLFNRRHYWWHGLSVAVLLSCFAIYLFNFEPRQKHPDQRRAPIENTRQMKQRPMPPHDDFPKPEKGKHLAPPDIFLLLIALLMFGVNIGVDAMIKAQKQRERLQLLEKRNLQQELEYLKYQINPHFFMNTLNNIHVLISIDQEKAQRSLIELSNLMRYMLYEGNGSLVSLRNETEFIEHYLSLMKLRYNKNVDILCQMASDTEGIKIPPLLLVTFIENAFKHGISYKEPSFIHIYLGVDREQGQIIFQCRNSKFPKVQVDGQGGIGLENVRKRLDLIFDKNYCLSVDEHNEKEFVLTLELPIS